MKIRVIIPVISGLIGMLAFTHAKAWEANPLANRYRQGDPRVIAFDPLHETITWSALDCAGNAALTIGADGIKECPPISFEQRSREPGNFDVSLIRGVLWNDDPNQLLNSVHYATWLIYMKDGKKRADQINSRWKMQYRSHYGDLQFLHAMASKDGEAGTVTRDNILEWIRFAYAVSIGAIDGDTRLEKVGLPITEKHFADQAGWTVSHLFNPKYRLVGDSLPDYALGTIAHTIEDSYAAGHTDRDPAQGAECPLGSVNEFHGYRGQDPDKHHVADTRKALEGADGRMVGVVARMIEFQRTRADWDRDVRPFVEKVFCVTSSTRPSGPGRFAKGT